jgi:uncharacterized integral membrane protein
MTDVAAPPVLTSQSDAVPLEIVTSEARSGHQTERTRISAAWVGVIAGALVLILLLVFILQNTRMVRVSYFTTTGSMPLGVALLLAAIAGVLLAGGVATLRIWQLRHRLTRQERYARLAPVLNRSDVGGGD